MKQTLSQLKAELLKEIKDYLESKGVKGEDLKQRIKELKEKCPPDLRYNLLKLKDYYETKKPKIDWHKNKKINQGDTEMGDRVELQKKIDALKKLNKAQLVNIAKEGRYMGVKFDPFTIAPGTDTNANVKSIAYELQDAMGLGSDKAKTNQEAGRAERETTKKTPTRTVKPAAKAGNPAINKAFMDATDTPLSKAKEALKAEKEKSKGIVADLKAKSKADIEVLKGKHKDTLLKATEHLQAEKDKGKLALEVLGRKAENHFVAKMDKAGKDLSRLQLKLSLSLENEKRVLGLHKEAVSFLSAANKINSSLKKVNLKSREDLAKGIKFLEKLI
jgi:hypothetical protein